MIAVDAFSSDSIPVHLITREALAVFLRHLKPDGVVAFHVSNRFLRLAPVVAQLAADAGLDAIDIVDDPTDDDDTIRPSGCSSRATTHSSTATPSAKKATAIDADRRLADVDRPVQQSRSRSSSSPSPNAHP